jgi:hypothetical protein
MRFDATRAASSVRLLKSTDKIKQGLANWFLFDRKKTACKSGTVTGPEE